MKFKHSVNRLDNKRPLRRGVILVFVLAILAICGAIYSQFASKVIRLNSNAAATERELQSRWASVSLRRALLDNAALLLQNESRVSEEAPQLETLASSSFLLQLNQINYAITVDDESGKLPIAALLKQHTPEKVRGVIRELAGGRAILQPILPKDLTHWPQVFQNSGNNILHRSLAELHAMTQKMTLWSDGKLNIRSCNDETLDALWRTKFGVSATKDLHTLRHNVAFNNLSSLAAASGLGPSQTEFLMQWAATYSNTYSIWIDAAKQTGSGFTAIYVKRSKLGFAEEHFGFHNP